MTRPKTLAIGAWRLVPAGPADRPAIEALQKAAYAQNRRLLGVEPLPLMADYGAILADYEAWLVRDRDALAGVLIVDPRPDDLLIWSVATAPSHQGSGLGRALLAAAEVRARQLGRSVLRLYTGATLEHLIAWYGRHGYRIERIEALSDRRIAHMMKRIAAEA